MTYEPHDEGLTLAYERDEVPPEYGAPDESAETAVTNSRPEADHDNPIAQRAVRVLFFARDV